MSNDITPLSLGDFLNNGVTCPDCGGKVTVATSEPSPLIGGDIRYDAHCPACQIVFTVPITDKIRGGAIQSTLRHFLDQGVPCPLCGETIKSAHARRSPEIGTKMYNASCPRCKAPSVVICS